MKRLRADGPQGALRTLVVGAVATFILHIVVMKGFELVEPSAHYIVGDLIDIVPIGALLIWTTYYWKWVGLALIAAFDIQEGNFLYVTTPPDRMHTFWFWNSTQIVAHMVVPVLALGLSLYVLAKVGDRKQVAQSMPEAHLSA